MSYNMDTTCRPHTLHMVIQSRVHSTQHRLSIGVYKVDQFVKSFLLSFLVFTLIQEFVLLPNSKGLKFITNIRRKKMLYQYLRSYIMKKQVKYIAYYLKLLSILRRLHLVFNIIKLTIIFKDLISSRHLQTSLDFILINR